MNTIEMYVIILNQMPGWIFFNSLLSSAKSRFSDKSSVVFTFSKYLINVYTVSMREFSQVTGYSKLVCLQKECYGISSRVQYEDNN